MSRLVDALEKLRWADHLFSELEAHAWEWVADKTHVPPFAEKMPYPEQRKIALRFTEPPPVTADWALLAADVINNYRSALDYIAWQLTDMVKRPVPLTEHQERSVGFPVVNRWGPNETPEGAFGTACSRCLPGVDPPFIGVVEQHQPYKWGDAKEDHPLSRLVRFSNHDKHRELRLVHLRPTKATWHVAGEVNCEVVHTEDFTGGNLKPRTEFAWIFYSPTGNGEPDVEVSISTKAVVAFEDGPVFETTMREIAKGVHAVVDDFRRIVP